jgi:hypothetical protein
MLALALFATTHKTQTVTTNQKTGIVRLDAVMYWPFVAAKDGQSNKTMVHRSANQLFALKQCHQHHCEHCSFDGSTPNQCRRQVHCDHTRLDTCDSSPRAIATTYVVRGKRKLNMY